MKAVTRTSRREPTPNQLSRLETLRRLIYGRRNKRTLTTLDVLQEQGHITYWKRVRWTGGVGSYAIMRGGVLRVLVSATKSGMTDPRWHDVPVAPGLVQSVEIPGRRRGYRYGWCVELRP